MGSTRSTVW